MREIKFRAWDKKSGLMFQINEMEFNMQTASCVSAATPYPYDKWNPSADDATEPRDWHYNWLGQDGEDVALMQYTGLKDKNGVEIYEGDVVSYGVVGIENIGSRDLEHALLGAIEWNTGSGCWLIHNYRQREPKQMGAGLSVEVIADIYENPELLKQGTTK